MARYIIHVNRQFVAYNAKAGKAVLPTYIVREGKRITYAFAVDIEGPSKLTYAEKNGLPCGARAWIETDGPLKYARRMTFDQALKLKGKKNG